MFYNSLVTLRGQQAPTIQKTLIKDLKKMKIKKLFLYMVLGLLLFSHQSFAKVVEKTFQIKCGKRLQDLTTANISLIITLVYEDSGFELKN